MTTDQWHFKRTILAEQVVGMFDSGMSNALVFFAPRRMGKTEFLLKDIIPFAKEKSWNCFYFSFLDSKKYACEKFTDSLAEFVEQASELEKTRGVLRHVSKIGGSLPGGFKANLEFRDKKPQRNDLKKLLTKLAKYGKTLFLLDEIQVLSTNGENEPFISALRTALDTNKDNLKVIFTGSSREGLRRMFSKSTAPFFHFGQNLPFPELDKKFTDHLSEMFHLATKRRLSKEKLWKTFIELEKVPQLARSLVERLALNPSYTLDEAKAQLLTDLYNDRAFTEMWEKCTNLERLILQKVAIKSDTLFGIDTRNELAEKLGINDLTVSSIQSAIRTLQKKHLIGRLDERGSYFIDDPNFKAWLQENC